MDAGFDKPACPEEEKFNQDHTFKEMLDIGELQELATASSSQAA